MRLAGYARYSSGNQRAESIDAQIRAIKEYAAREGHVIVAMYVDEERSALTDNRPEFLKMISDASCGLFDAVAVHKYDRFTRDRYDSAFYKRKLAQNGVKLISVLERLDDSPESIILESVIEGMAEYYSRNLAREVMKGLKESAYNCKHTGGRPPLGYDVDEDKSYVVNIREAEAVRLIFEMYTNRKGYTKIVDELNSRGYRTKTGRLFSKGSIHDILINEKYTGVYVYNRAVSKDINGKRNTHKSKDATEIIKIDGGIPAIIKKETFERVRKIMKKVGRNAENKAKRVYILTGKIYCGECGSAMVGNTSLGGRSKKYYSYYECNTRKRTKGCNLKPVNAEDIEIRVLLALRDNVFTPEAARNAAKLLVEYANEQKSEIPERLTACRQRLSKVRREIDNIVSAIAEGMYHESMKEKLDVLEEEKVSLINEISMSDQWVKRYEFTFEDARRYLEKYGRIMELSPEEQKDVVYRFVSRITIYHDKLDIDITPWSSKNPDTYTSGFGYDGGDGGARTPDLLDVSEAL